MNLRDSTVFVILSFHVPLVRSQPNVLFSCGYLSNIVIGLDNNSPLIVILSSLATKRCSNWLINKTVIQTCYKCNYTGKLAVRKQAYSPLNEVMIIIGFTNINQ